MPRVAIGIEYLGTDFCGWQRQNHAASIQAAVELAASRVADESVTVVAAGRTDAGVHATGQVGHFDSTAQRTLRSWLRGLNSNLPAQISISWVHLVTESFHARYAALARTYHYLIFNRTERSALYHNRAWWVHSELDLPAMQAAARILVGEHDFSAFRAAQCQAGSPVREIHALTLRRCGPFIVVKCRANAFLHHMVRNIVGSLVRIGRREASPDWLRHVMESRDRREGGVTAEAAGLYLTRVRYPEAHGIPQPAQFRYGDP
ncbi:MAG: tRNA pseudouridine(38-40) synthase TruA [Gammaproteobacteria bacterium]|nr:MAG: tRNA pseudouridine(38-40) synthase TruA [Gammaproteobacteria bacterium]